MRDKGVFAPAAVGLLIGIASLASMSDGMTPVESLMHVGLGVIGFAMAIAAFGFAMRWNAPAAQKPAPPPVAHPTSAAGTSATSSTDDHLHSTLGTAGVGGDMAVGRLGTDVATGTAFDSSAGFSESDSGGSDSGGADFGGADSGGGSGFS